MTTPEHQGGGSTPDLGRTTVAPGTQPPGEVERLCRLADEATASGDIEGGWRLIREAQAAWDRDHQRLQERFAAFDQLLERQRQERLELGLGL